MCASTRPIGWSPIASTGEHMNDGKYRHGSSSPGGPIQSSHPMMMRHAERGSLYHTWLVENKYSSNVLYSTCRLPIPVSRMHSTYTVLLVDYLVGINSKGINTTHSTRYTVLLVMSFLVATSYHPIRMPFHHTSLPVLVVASRPVKHSVQQYTNNIRCKHPRTPVHYMPASIFILRTIVTS